MTTHDTYAQGMPCWADLQTTDTDGAKAFYGGLFGWTFDDQPMPQGATYSMGPGFSYTMFLVDGRQVGGSTPPQGVGAPNHWNVWFATADADATAATATELGGTVLVAPMDMPVGRMCVIRDPQGGVINVMQSGDGGDDPA
jgi:predicted enzyme related to lactoylglutathione lyase